MTHNFTNNIFHPDTREPLFTLCTHCGVRNIDEAARAPCSNAPAANAGVTAGGGSAVYVPPHPSVYLVHVDEIPDGLIDDETKSNSASTMFSSEEIKVWFRNLINADDLVINHPEESDNDPHAPRNFEAYIPKFLSDGFKVWNVQSSLGANTRLVLESNGRYVTISGRPDFLICDGHTVLGIYLAHTRGIVKVQSDPDEERCELQLMLYLFVYMNRYGLGQVVGFLVYTDGQVRAYKASRYPTSIMYEENDRFHVQHIDDIFRQLNASNN